MSARLERLRDMRAWIDAEIAEEVGRMGSPVGATSLIHEAAELYGVAPADILSGSRRRQVCNARQAASWLLRNRADLSFPHIGRMLGCDHTTVLHACRKIDASPPLRALVSGLEGAA